MEILHSHIIPENTPYTIRLVSDILGSLAFMDAGVSGISMGLIMDKKKDKNIILNIGEMDLKVAVTKKGITACQMDIKIDGIYLKVFKQAYQGRIFILQEMLKTQECL